MARDPDRGEHAETSEESFMRMPAALVTLSLAALACASPSAQAQSWQFEASIYAYFPKAGGTTNFPASGGGSTVAIDGDPLLDHLKFAFMGSLAAQNGQWGVFTDYIHVDFGHQASGSRAIEVGGVLPVGASASIDYGLKGSLWTLAGTWRAPTSPAYTLDVLFGVRMLDIDAHLSYALGGNVGSIALQDRSGSRSASQTNWDGIVGVRGRMPFGSSGRWFVPFYLDVGTGKSSLTWQATAGVGYAFGWGDVVGSWRYVDYRMKSGQPIDTLNFNGPAIAAVFHW
jgi:hypothetical protein